MKLEELIEFIYGKWLKKMTSQKKQQQQKHTQNVEPIKGP